MRKGGGGGRRAILKDVCRDMCARACDTERWNETSTGMRVCESEESARENESESESEREREEREEREGGISTHHHHRLHHFLHARSLATHTALQ